jgi:iron complex outermembrane receptor protein
MSLRPASPTPSSLRRHWPWLLAALPAAGAWAQQTVVITGSVVERAVQDAPYAISVVDRDELRSAGPMINLSEALQRVPGLVVNNRSNYAQDLQISSRGFGARATFGVRGLRLYADGIPATGPDGQGQVSHFDIAGAERVEVLRGPFSVLYGNSSGGVISIFSAPAKRTEVEGELDVGSFGLRQLRLSGASPLDGGFDLRGSVSQMEIDGFRPQSAARKQQAAARLGWRGASDSVTVLLNHLDQPADDPLGLTREDFELGPDQTAQQAIDYDTRKLASQLQLGVAWQHRFGDGALRESQLAAYAGQRSVTQWLAIPNFVQASPNHGGGVIDFDRDYHGVDMRLRWGWTDVDLVVGVALERQRDDRRGYENFIGDPPVYGLTGTLRRDEINEAETRDIYAQGEWTVTPTVAAILGVRSGSVDLSSTDAYLSNGDDSGSLDFRYTNPVAGLRWQAAPGLNLHVSVARGFESPTLGELAYQVGGTGGFNTDLKAQTSRQIELGAKWRTPTLSLDLAVFEARTSDEIGVVYNAGGRSAYQNVGRTLRRGAEVALGWQPAPAWRAQLAASTLEATYRDSFLTCDGIPCLTPSATVPAGNRIAGVPRGNAWGELAWRDAAWGEFGAEWHSSGSVAVNDRNTDFAAGHDVFALRWSKGYALGNAGARMEWLLRVDNLFDRHYAGSVIVNDANGRFFEPGAPRNFLVGLRLIGVL